MSTFGQCLRAAIKGAGLTQRKVAEGASLNEAQISHYCNDVVFPGPGNVHRIREVLTAAGAKMDWLARFGLDETTEEVDCHRCGGTGKLRVRPG